jgi:DNA-binding transcriptional LysR family regulator
MIADYQRRNLSSGCHRSLLSNAAPIGGTMLKHTQPISSNGRRTIGADSLPQIIAFVSAVKHGGFSGAGRRLGLSASAVGKSVSRLERSLGVRLLQRTTRNITLTEIGEGIFERYTDALELLGQAELLASDEASLLTGTLRLDLPRVYGARVIGPMLVRFSRIYPALGLDIRLNDEICNIVENGVDLAIRIGEVSESRLVARSFDTQEQVVVASPAYLAEQGRPHGIDDLPYHQCLGFRHASHGRIRPWRFNRDGQEVQLNIEHRYLFDEGIALKRAAEAGFGIVQVPRYMVERAVGEGTLEYLLDQYCPVKDAISLVYASQARHSPKLRALVDFLLAESRQGRIGPIAE